MANLWDDIAKTIREGVGTVVEKTEELTKIGKIKIDILNIKRNIEKNFSELGGRVYHLIIKEKKTEISTDKEAREVIECIKILEKELDDKKSELAKVKSKKSSTSESKSATKTEAKKTTAKKSTGKPTASKKSTSPKTKAQTKK
ncbi:hypothetical protein IH824_00195 [candidate division KSB1 bacterium]|nr:hypothetical protein [candidate division KSB1 bacterium]